MKFRDLIPVSNFESYRKAEDLIIEVLQFHIKKQDKHFEDRRFSVGANWCDAIANNGFDDFKDKTAIEIVLRTGSINLVIQKLQNSAKNEDVKNILLIIPRDNKYIQFYKRRRLPTTSEVNIVYWDIDQIDSLLETNSEKTKEISEKLFTLSLNNIKKEADTYNWKKENEIKIKELTSHYKKSKISLFLGAGVSRSAGLPDWSTLLNSLFISLLNYNDKTNQNEEKSEIIEFIDMIKADNSHSSLMMARYLKEGFSSANLKLDFNKQIKENLYNLKNKETSSELIEKIAKLCLPYRTGAKVKSVISYNFDDLIEKKLEETSIEFKSIYSDDQEFSNDELPIYHVHGYLPEDTNNNIDLGQMTLVFSEESYHQIYSDPYHWSNLIQLNSLKENTCLMIGLSLADPNIRRLLDISVRNRKNKKHFAILPRLTVRDYATRSENSQKRIIQNLETHHLVNERIMENLGISVIWIEDFKEIPQILERIRI